MSYATAVPRVIFYPPLSVAVSITVSVARSAEERSRGLQSTRLPPGHGLLIVYPQPVAPRLWMKDVPIDLDMIFLSPSGTVIAVLRDVPAMSTETRGGLGPCKYVVEVPAGFANANGIVVGTPALLDLVDYSN